MFAVQKPLCYPLVVSMQPVENIILGKNGDASVECGVSSETSLSYAVQKIFGLREIMGKILDSADH